MILPAVLAAAAISAVSALEIPSLTQERILLIQQEHEETGSGALKYAEPHPVSINPSNDGVWDPETNTWKLTVESPGAKSLNFGFSRFDLPPGTRLRIENANASKANVQGLAVDSTLTTKDKQLWTQIIRSDKVTITLTYKDRAKMMEPPSEDITLGFVNVGFVDLGGEKEKSGGCNIDVVCPERAGWESEIPSAGGVSTGGSLFCSGAMINNMEEDQTPFFLTATHCGITAGNAGSFVPYWNFETSSCGLTPPDGSLDQFTLGGADYLSGTSQFDGTLIRLVNSPDPSYRVTFSGWDNTPEAYQVTPGVCIHHPSGDEKRISFENDDMQTTNYGSNSQGPDKSHVKVIDWDLGTTEPGSSGSPLYNGNHRIIGQLHGGSAACGNDLPDWYGRFSKSWGAAGWAEWLDPNDVLGGGSGGIDTFDPYAFPTISPAPTPAPTDCEGPIFGLELTTDNWGSETSWTLSNVDTGSQPLSGGGYQSNSDYTVDECILGGGFCYEFTIFDSFGDGICCGFGSGSYTITLDGEILGSGGEFGDSETIDFCTDDDPGPPDTCVDSELEVPFSGNLFDCSDVVSLGACSHPLAPTHCPLSCEGCDDWGCADSLAPWVVFGGTYTCEMLAAQSPGNIPFLCDTYDLDTTCRATCGYCPP